MTRIASKSALLALMVASGLAGQSVADPLHEFGNDGAWRHVDSGWMFPLAVSDFSRIGQPYNIDGNNDAGAEYRSAQVAAEVDVFAADSGATDATFDGAKSTAARKAGEAARARGEQAFQLDALRDVKGVKVSYAAEASGAQTNLYYFTTDKWRVKVLASSQVRGKDGDQAVDAFVRALPWETLGTESGLH